MHYSEKIIQELEKLGWKKHNKSRLAKRFESIAPAGTFSDGDRLVFINICDRERYFEAYLGWDFITDIDGRMFIECEELGAKTLSENVEKALYNK